METIDPEMARRVWQRVQGTGDPSPVGPDLPTMIQQELADAAAYLHLSRLFSGHYGQLLRQMYHQEQAHAACLKGVCRVTTGKRCSPRLPKILREKPLLTLQRCYQRELQSAAQYEARAGDSRFGQTFARLAQQEQEHCRILLELLGTFSPKE